MRRRVLFSQKIYAALIISTGIFFAAAIFFYFQFADTNAVAPHVNISVQWTEKAGKGIVAPACNSANADSYCVGATPRVHIDWFPTSSTHTACSNVDMYIGTEGPDYFLNPTVHLSGWPCTGTFDWDGGAFNTTYWYQIIATTPYGQLYPEKLILEGNFTN